MRAVVIFVKAPVAGFVKTRLAASVGKKQAAHLYQAMATETLRVAQSVPRATVLVAYQSHPKMPRPTWLTPSSKWFHQKGTGLGRRLVHAAQMVFDKCGGPILIIGSDLPTLTRERLEKAFHALQKASVVLGPSRDGGYYLIGLRSPQPPLFRKISWSSPRVFKQTVAALKRLNHSFTILPVERDIDTIEDVRSFIAEC